jgi:hypothetical protein
MATKSPLAIYLTDHLGGAAAGRELAAKLRAKYEGTPRGEVFERLLSEVEADKRTLERLVERFRGGSDPVKHAVGWTIEKLSRLKTSDLLGGGAHSVVELEAMALGIRGKLALWHALREVQPDEPRLKSVDLDELIRRAESQFDAVERERLAAAREVLRT